MLISLSMESRTIDSMKGNALSENGIMVVDRIGHIQGVGLSNQNYLDTKAKRKGHILPFSFNK